MFTLPAPLLLASSSISRIMVLAKLGLPFIDIAPEIDETPYNNELPINLVQRLSLEKAKALASLYPNHLIIGSDQVCLLNGTITGKPYTESMAIAQLMQASGRTIVFYTGLALYYPQTNKYLLDVEQYTVHFRVLTESEIKRYVQLDQPLHCAGSFKSEGLGVTLFDRLEGNDPNALMGLPLIRLCDMLRQAQSGYFHS